MKNVRARTPDLSEGANELTEEVATVLRQRPIRIHVANAVARVQEVISNHVSGICWHNLERCAKCFLGIS